MSSRLEVVLSEVEERGFGVLEGALDDGAVTRYKDALLAASERILEDIGQSRLARSLARGDADIRLPMVYDERLLEVLAEPALLAVVDALLSPKAVLRFQNGFIQERAADRPLGQHSWHMNFPVVHNGYRIALDVVLLLTDATHGSGPLVVVPGSQQSSAMPAPETLESAGEAVLATAGSMIVMDSTVWHRETPNVDSVDQIYMTHQFVRPYIKPHFDHVRALGEEKVRNLPERTQRLLGWTTRLPTSLQEFYVEPEQRLYRADEW
jgi:ectoine hydroxylase-related dioxygenase (phytanoyl-CoA dioxygenase family)